MSSQNKITDNLKNEYITYRYKLSENIIDMIKEFIHIHKYDDRKTYKESWKEFCIYNEDIILRETKRLSDNGYKGSVIDKMYKAGRYYFLKKNNCEKKQQQKKRRIYISMDSDVIYSIDEHIKNNINDKEFKPAKGYKEYCDINNKIINDEKNRLINEYSIDIKIVNDKIKKTYKNRYYIISRNNIM